MTYMDATQAELYDLKDRIVKAERCLERLGYRHCDIPACNCNGYHCVEEITDKARLDWIEKQGNGDGWYARQSFVGRGFRLHNTTIASPELVKRTVREAIDTAMRLDEP